MVILSKSIVSSILRRVPRHIVVLGSGPAGLFAAHAAQQYGHAVSIFSRPIQSPLHGAQYLHEPIEGLTIHREPEKIDYQLKGTVDEYRRKVYGTDVGVHVSPETLTGKRFAWNLRSTYERAWQRFGHKIIPTDIDPTWLNDLAPKLGADLFIWTIPLRNQCIGGHFFSSSSIWAVGDYEGLHECPVTVPQWTVIANGEESPRWYRASNVFNHRTVEWPGGPRPPVDGIVPVNKPIKTNCDCWSSIGGATVLRIGRFGKWDKNYLTHHAYYDTLRWLARNKGL